MYKFICKTLSDHEFICNCQIKQTKNPTYIYIGYLIETLFNKGI